MPCYGDTSEKCGGYITFSNVLSVQGDLVNYASLIPEVDSYLNSTCNQTINCGKTKTVLSIACVTRQKIAQLMVKKPNSLTNDVCSDVCKANGFSVSETNYE